MRPKVKQQLELDLQFSNLKLTNDYHAKYDAISDILDANPLMVNLIHEDIKNTLASTTQKGPDGRSYKYTSETVLRILLCQIIEGDSLRGITIRIDDSYYLRRFTRIGYGPMMDFTTLDKLKNAISSETWKKVNEQLAKHAVQRSLISGEKTRLDTTAVETNIHRPTDSALLWDVYRVLARLLEQARKLDAESVGDRRLQTRKAKKLHTKIARKASKKPQATEALKPLYLQLLALVTTIGELSISVAAALRQGVQTGKYAGLDCAMAEAIAEDLTHYQELGGQVIDQARRRVIHGENVPNDEKLFSIFEPHTELLIRGKAGKEIEFGHMIQIQQVAQKFITDYGVYAEKPVEYTLLDPALENHKKLFGQYPHQLAADKGYYQSMEHIKELSNKVSLVGIAKKGNRTEEQTERESDPAFRHAQRFRAGVEGTISFLKRVLGLGRCYNKGWPHFVSTIGAAVLAHNLLILVRC